MEAELVPGRQVWVKLPYGEFCVEGDNDVCLLAGGTGITAFTAFLAGLSAKHAPRIDLFYGARQPGLLIYRSVVEAAVARSPSLHAHYLAEQNANGSGCLAGRLEWGTIGNLIRAPLAMTYYLSGPPPMLTGLRGELEGRGVAPERIRVDAWE
jgi:ferredoxin-NADP reductase